MAATDRATSATVILGDKRAYEARLAEEVSRSTRSSAPLAVVLIDVDRMRDVNARAGRQVGDAALREIGHVLRRMLRLSDQVFRYGDDEFALVLPETDVAAAYLVAERCRDAIAAVTVEGEPLLVSVGVADHANGRAADQVTQKAELALLRAKESGGNRSWRADDPRRRGLSAIALSEDLTDREWDVLAHLAHRRSEQDIARRMGIRPGTVRSHKARIRRKLHVAPNQRLSEFARTNFRDLVDRLDRNAGRGRPD